MSKYWRCFVFLALLVALQQVSNAQKNTKILSIPGKDGSQGYTKISQWKDNLNYTFCLWLKLDDYKSIDYPLVYLHGSEIIIGVSIFMDIERHLITIGSAYTSKIYTYCPPQSWFHLCVVFLPNKPSPIYVNGKEVQDTITANTGKWRGQMTFPRSRSKKFGLKIREFNNFKGMIYDANVWNSALTEQQISDLANCKSKEEGNQISWTYLTQNLQLKDMEFITDKGPCTTPITREIMVPIDNNRDLKANPIVCNATNPKPVLTKETPSTTEKPQISSISLTTPVFTSPYTSSYSPSGSSSYPLTTDSSQYSSTRKPSFSTRKPSFSNQQKGLSQTFSTVKPNFSNQPNDLSQPSSSGIQSLLIQSNGLSEPSSSGILSSLNQPNGLSQLSSSGILSPLIQSNGLSQPSSSGILSSLNQPNGLSQPFFF